MKLNHRALVLALVIALALLATVSTLSAATFENPNCEIRDQKAPYGEPEHWMFLGDAFFFEKEPNPYPNDGGFIPDTNKKNAVYQHLGLAGAALPDHFSMEMVGDARQLTANTAFVGVIAHHGNGATSRLYKALPAGTNHIDMLFYPYVSGDVNAVTLGVLFFGNRGSGEIAVHYLCFTS